MYITSLASFAKKQWEPSIGLLVRGHYNSQGAPNRIRHYLIFKNIFYFKNLVAKYI